MSIVKFDGKEPGNEYNLAIDTSVYPYQASLYIWTKEDNAEQFDKRASDLIGKEVKAVEWMGGNGHEGGLFITVEDFNKNYCKHRTKIGKSCYNCQREKEESEVTLDDIQACPFCGWSNGINKQTILSIKVKTVQRHDGEKIKHYIECLICGTSGPMLSETDGGAILDWNKRRPPLIERFKND